MAVPGASTARRPALALVAAASVAALAALLVSGRAADWTFALATALLPVALMALGAAGRRGIGPAASALLALFAVLAAAVAGILALSGEAAARTVVGFPLAAVVQVVGLWLLPLPVATLAYALSFARTGLSRCDLDELRARAAGSGHD